MLPGAGKFFEKGGLPERLRYAAFLQIMPGRADHAEGLPAMSPVWELRLKGPGALHHSQKFEAGHELSPPWRNPEQTTELEFVHIPVRAGKNRSYRETNRRGGCRISPSAVAQASSESEYRICHLLSQQERNSPQASGLRNGNEDARDFLIRRTSIEREKAVTLVTL
jgi:hypothetical protein